MGWLWTTGFGALVATAVLVPLLPLWHDAAGVDGRLAWARAVAGTAAACAGFAAVVLAHVTGDRRLRWAAAGFALILLLELTADAGLLPHQGPALWAVVAALCAGVSVAWLRPSPPLRWVGLGLALGAVAAGLRAASRSSHDRLWWAGLLGVDLALLVPAVVLTTQAVLGYGLQSRRWRRLEAEVKALRRGTRLLEGRSVTPEDDEGLPGEVEVAAIIELGAVQTALQPVLVLGSGTVVGHEALSRFGGRVPTDRWFKAAARYELGSALEQLCLGAALALLPTLPAHEFLAVNVSPLALADPDVLGLLESVDLRRIVVEITEHEAVADYALTRGVLGRLRAAGARIAVDDAGAGFASLRHVLMLQPDIIKLDIGLTRNVDVDRRQQALVRAITVFGATVGATVLAEGVETSEQLIALREIGVELGQGWHLGVPALVT